MAIGSSNVSRVRSSLENIENAIKYAPQGTDVAVTLKREWRDVRLSVRNSGSYINKEDLPHIFERFYRSDKTRGSSGFGLGLSIAKGLCEKMNAEIKCESKENIGTEFTVDFNVDLSTLIPNLRIKRNDS
jgi:signal transduction histidine kinase